MLACVVRAALVAAGLLPEPASAAGAARLGYVGRVAETDAFVGIVIRGRAVTGYVCDGRKLARWLQGKLTDEPAPLRSRSGGRIEPKITPAGPRSSRR